MIVARSVSWSAIVVLCWAGLAWGYEDGPPPNRSGVSGITCTECHSGGSSAGSVDGLPSAWTPGETYALQVSVARSAIVYGFQMTALGADGTQAGSFTAGTGMAVSPGNIGGNTIDHIQHSTPSVTSSFSFEWTAPSTLDAGNVQFNVAANAANGDGSSFGDFIYSDEVVVPPASETSDGLDSDAEKIFAYAESDFPIYFSPAATTANAVLDGIFWRFRYYSGTDTYLGVSDLSEVAVLGPAFGPAPLTVGSVDSVLAMIPGTPPPPPPPPPDEDPPPDDDPPEEEYLSVLTARSVMGGVSGELRPGSDRCVVVPFPAAGLTGSYIVTVWTGKKPGTSRFSTTWAGVASTHRTVHTETSATVSGLTSTTVTDSTEVYFISDGYTYLTSGISATSSTVSGDTTASDQNVTYDAPYRFDGPSLQLCEGQSWYSAPASYTRITTAAASGSVTQTGKTSPSAGSVNAIDQTVSVPAGEFATVKVTTTSEDPREGASTNVAYIDQATGLVVRRDVFDDSGNLVSQVVATSIE